MDEVELTVDRIAVGGRGLGLDPDGRATFVAGSVPTEQVRVRLTKQSRRFAEAEVSEVLEPSPDRVEPACPHTVGEERCGGCDWQHVEFGAQRRLRVSMVEDSLRRIGKLDTAQFPIMSADPLPALAYRTGVRMLVDADGRLAYRQPQSHIPFRPHSCAVAHPLVEELIRSVRCARASEATIRVGVRTGERSLLVDTAVDRVEAPLDVRVTDRSGGVQIHEVVDGFTLRISAGAFFQSSTVGAELLVDQVRAALGPIDRSGTLLDAYSGGGLFSATIGSAWNAAGGSVLAVESNPISVADAKLNAPFARTVESRFERWKPEPVDAAIADPARSGLGKDGVAALVAAEPNVIVLVSCEAGALGRDAGLLAASGYRVSDVRVLDLFNQTSHVEVVTRFERV